MVPEYVINPHTREEAGANCPRKLVCGVELGSFQHGTGSAPLLFKSSLLRVRAGSGFGG
jgi:hypothetical protein